MSGLGVVMVGSTQRQIVQVEDLLRSFSGTRTTTSARDAASARSSSFYGRPIIATFLAFFIFAPGCAAAAVFLMRGDGQIPPIMPPDSNPPFVAKSDRLPLDQWSTDAAARTGSKDDTRFAAAEALADPILLDPVLIRGSLYDETITSFADSPTMPNAFASMDKPSLEKAWTEKPQSKRMSSRVRPPKLVAAITPPQPPQPSFFEKLFGPRVN